MTTAAAQHGLVALAGSAPDVGVAGYTLGGGLSWLGRSYGLAANSVVAIEVVTADGASRRVDRDHDPDLFWALRGGGGSLEVRHLGGALRPDISRLDGTAGGAVAGIDAAFAVFAVGITPTLESAMATRSAVDAVQHALAPGPPAGPTSTSPNGPKPAAPCSAPTSTAASPKSKPPTTRPT